MILILHFYFFWGGVYESCYKCFEETTPEEVVSSYIRNTGNTPPLKSKIIVIIY